MTKKRPKSIIVSKEQKHMIKIPKYGFKDSKDPEVVYQDEQNHKKFIQDICTIYLPLIRDNLRTAAKRCSYNKAFIESRKAMVEEIIYHWFSTYERSDGVVTHGDILIGLSNIIESMNRKDYKTMRELIKKLPYGDSNGGDSLSKQTLMFVLWFMPHKAREENKDLLIESIKKAHHGNVDAEKKFEEYVSASNFKALVEYNNECRHEKN